MVNFLKSSIAVEGQINPARIFNWLICESYDDKGNAIVYEYASENELNIDLTQANEGNRERVANRHLKCIKYGNRISRLIEPDFAKTEWMFKVIFDYDQDYYEALELDPTRPETGQHRLVRASAEAGNVWAVRPYPFSSHRAGFEVRTYRRRRRVLTFHGFAELIAEQIAHHEYLSVQQQIENAREVDDFLHDKFTNEQLYLWMQGEISRLYYEYYRFAFDVARKAERTMKLEVMRPEMDAQDFVKFNYWDGGRKGLLSGEALHLDVKRMEMAYIENNKREIELTRHVSLRQLNPLALLLLKTTGACQVTIPEWLYDRDGAK